MSVANDVWGTLGESVSASIKALTDVAVTRINKPTTASPSTPAPANPNPFPGMWSIFPQSDTKQQYQNPSIFSFGGINPLWIVLGGLVLLLFFVRR